MNKFIKHDRSYTVDIPQDSIGPLNISAITYQLPNDENDCSYINKLNTTFTQPLLKPQQSNANFNSNNSIFNYNSVMNTSQLGGQGGLGGKGGLPNSSNTQKATLSKPLDSTQEQVGHLTALQRHLEAEMRGEQNKLKTQLEMHAEKQAIMEQRQKKRDKELLGLHRQMAVEEEKQNMERQVVLCDPFQRKDRINQIFANQNKLDQSMLKMRELLARVPEGLQKESVAQEMRPLEERLRALLEEKTMIIHTIFEEQDAINTLRERAAMCRAEGQAYQLQNGELLCQYEDLEGIIEEIKLQYPKESQHICDEIMIQKNLQQTKEEILAKQTVIQNGERECAECKSQIDNYTICIERCKDKLENLRTIKANSRAEAECSNEESRKMEQLMSEMIEENGLPYWRDICRIYSLGEGMLEVSNERHQILFKVIAQVQQLILEELKLLCSCTCLNPGQGQQQGGKQPLSPVDKRKRLLEITQQKKSIIYQSKEIIFNFGEVLESAQVTLTANQVSNSTLPQAQASSLTGQTNKVNGQQEIQQIITGVLTCDQLFLNMVNAVREESMRSKVEEYVISYLKQKLERFEESVSCSKAIFEATEEYKGTFNQMICKETVKCQLEKQVVELQIELEQLQKKQKQLEQKKREKANEYKVIAATLCEEFFQQHVAENQIQLKDLKFKFGKAYVEKMEQEIRNKFFELNKAQVAQARQRLQELLQQQENLEVVRRRITERIEHELKPQSAANDQEINRRQEHICSLNAKLLKAVEEEQELRNNIEVVFSAFLKRSNQEMHLFDKNESVKTLFYALSNMKIWQGEEIVHNYDNILTPQAAKQLLLEKIAQVEREAREGLAKDELEVGKIEKQIALQRKLVDDLGNKLNKIIVALKDINNNITMNSEFIYKNFNLDFKKQCSSVIAGEGLVRNQIQGPNKQLQGQILRGGTGNDRTMQDITSLANNTMSSSQISTISNIVSHQTNDNKNSNGGNHRPCKSQIPTCATAAINSNPKFGKITINFMANDENTAANNNCPQLAAKGSITNSATTQFTGSVLGSNASTIMNLTSPSSATVSNRYNNSNNEYYRDSQCSGQGSAVANEELSSTPLAIPVANPVNIAVGAITTINVDPLLQPIVQQMQPLIQKNQQQPSSTDQLLLAQQQPNTQPQQTQKKSLLKRTASEVSQLRTLDLSQIQFCCQPVSPNKTPSGLTSGNTSRNQSPYTTNRKNSASKQSNCSFHTNKANSGLGSGGDNFLISHYPQHHHHPKAASDCSEGRRDLSFQKQLLSFADSNQKEQQQYSCCLEKMSHGFVIYKMFSTNNGTLLNNKGVWDPSSPSFRPEKNGFGRRILKYNAKNNAVEIVKESEQQGKRAVEFSSDKQKIISLFLPPSTQNILRGRCPNSGQSNKKKPQIANASTNIVNAGTSQISTFPIYLPFAICVENVGRIECLATSTGDVKLISEFFKILLHGSKQQLHHQQQQQQQPAIVN